MTLTELVAAARTCRRYKASFAPGEGVLADLVEAARLSPCARNGQVLRFGLVHSAEARQAMFGLVRLGGSFTPEQRPGPDQQPGGYIVIYGPKDIQPINMIDVGIAAQTINLCATASGLATCMIATFNLEGVKQLLGCPDDLEPKLLLAVGSPDEERQIRTVPQGESLTYFRDSHDVHWVPKLALDDLIISSK